jgi:hypothetical protein
MVNPQSYRNPGVRNIGVVPQQTAPAAGMHTAPMPQIGQPQAMPQTQVQSGVAGTGSLPKMPARTVGNSNTSALNRTGSIFGQNKAAMDGTGPMRTPLAGQGTNNIPQFNHTAHAARGLGGRRETNQSYEIPTFIRSKKDKKNED